MLCESSSRRLFIHPTGWELAVAYMDKPAKEGASGQDKRAAPKGAAVAQPEPDNAVVPDFEAGHLGLDHGQRLVLLDSQLHGLAIELAIGLCAGTAHGRSLLPVQQAKLDAGRIRNPPHQAIERIDLANEVALA